MKNEYRIIGDVAEIALTQGAVGLIDVADLEAISEFRWHARKVGRSFYMFSSHYGKIFKVDQWLMRPPPHLIVDHISGEGLDNRRANLRICSQSNNAKSQGKQRQAKQPKGVTMSSKTGWHARITCDGVSHNLGKFSSQLEAALAYDEAARRLHGEFARTNFDDPLGMLRSAA